jgi:UDP-N-acetylglucosamine acyltransferase
MPIHRTALIDARAEVHPDADIGPFVVIDGPVRVGPRTCVLAHATLTGWAEIGADNVIHMGAVIGDTPQDLGFDGAQSCVRIGDRNVIRENVQVWGRFRVVVTDSEGDEDAGGLVQIERAARNHGPIQDPSDG